LKSLPNVKKLEMWEDQKDLADKYTEEFSSDNFKFIVHIVDNSYSKSDSGQTKIKIKIKS
jgi:hypothetical protein